MRILFTNQSMLVRAGTEMYVHDVALALRRRGHQPMVYAPELGGVADALRDQLVPVVDDVRKIGEAPDLIHGHHHLELMTALARFPDTPAVTVCHGWRPWQELPLTAAQVRRFISVDEATHDRLVFEHGVPPDRIRLIPNFVDLERFPPRGPLPARPRRVLLYSNYAMPGSPYVLAAQAACARAGLDLDIVGAHYGNQTPDPAALLARYEIVLAQGRSAIEAMAVGAMVIICSSRRFGPPVRTDGLEELRARNFGVRTQTLPVSAALLGEHLRAYDPADAAQVSAAIRRTAGLEPAVDRLLEVYREAVEDFEAGRCREENRTALPGYLGSLSRQVRRIVGLEAALGEREAELHLLRARVQLMERSLTWRASRRLQTLPVLRHLLAPVARWSQNRAGGGA